MFNRNDEACNSSWGLDNTGQVAGVTTELRVAGRKYTVESDRQHTVTVAVTRRYRSVTTTQSTDRSQTYNIIISSVLVKLSAHPTEFSEALNYC